MGLIAVKDTLPFAATLALQQRLASPIEVFERLFVLIAREIPALKIEQPVYRYVDYVVDPATIYSGLVRMSVLKNDLDERPDDECVATIQAPEILHVFAHCATVPCVFDSM